MNQLNLFPDDAQPFLIVPPGTDKETGEPHQWLLKAGRYGKGKHGGVRRWASIEEYATLQDLLEELK